MMSRTRARQLCRMVFAMAVCLIAPACRTCREAGSEPGEALEPEPSDVASHTIRKLKEIVIPEMTFFPPATITDVVDFLQQASRDYDYDKPGTPPEQSGVGLVLHLPPAPRQGERDATDPFASGVSTNHIASRIAAMSVRFISLYDAIQLVCDVTDMKWRISEKGTVMLMPKVMWGDEDFVTRSYNIPYLLSARLFNRSAGLVPDADANKVWQAFFDHLGVTGPECATFEYLPSIGKLRVTNTPSNLAVIETVFDEFASRMIEVVMQIHAFRAKDIARLRLAGGVSVDTLMDLRHKGKSKPVAAATALTKSGQEAVVKAVREVIYPTELEMDCSLTGSNVTARSAFGALMPGNYETRETGMTLHVLPEVTQGGTLINLIVNPQWVTLEGWESYPADITAGWAHKTLALRQPVFGVTSFQTQFKVADGETILLGSCSTPDGEWVQVGFLTARLQEVRSESSGGTLEKAARARSRGRTDKARPQNGESCSAVAKKMRDIVIQEMTFRPPSTIIDALLFFKEASIKYDNTGVPDAQHGFNFVLKLPTNGGAPTTSGANVDPFAAPVPATNEGAPVISALSARFINLYDALKLVCDVSGMTFSIRDGVVWIMPPIQPCEELTTRVYPVLTSMCERMSNADCGRVGDNNRQDLKAFFAQMGVNWPEGFSVSYLASIGLLRVTNTPENLDVFEQVLDDLGVRPRLVEVEVQINAFRPEDIEKLRLSGGVSVASLTELRQKGNSKTVSSATVLTKAGNEAVVKSVREVLYPSELDMDGSQRGSGITSGGGVGALMPCLFEMREVGMCLQVVPEIAPDNGSLINLIVNPRWVTLNGWESYQADLAAGWTHKTLPLRQPVFGVTSFQTQVTVADGETVLLGCSSTPDGEWVHYGTLTARRVDVQR